MSYLVSDNELTTARNILIQLLQDNGYVGALEENSAVYDLIIKPNALIYALIQNDIARARSYLSLDEAERNKVMLGSEYDEIVDCILSNWFVTRKDGNRSSGYIRCYFASPFTYIASEKNTSFSIGGVLFIPPNTQVFEPLDFKEITSGTVIGGTQYWVEVFVETTEAIDVYPTPKSTVDANVEGSLFIKADIPRDFERGTAKESSDHYIARSKDVITTRELITEKAINTVLNDEFEGIEQIYVAGHGSSEITRDIRSFNGVTLHVGNYADIYLRTPVVRIEQKGYNVVDNMNTADIKYEPSVLYMGDSIYVQEILSFSYKDIRTKERIYPPYTVKKATYVYNDEGALLNKTATAMDPNIWGSSQNNTAIAVHARYMNATGDWITPPGLDQVIDSVEVVYLTNNLIPRVQDFITAPDNKVVNYDPLARGMNPIVLEIAVTVTKKKTSIVEDEIIINDTKDVITSYISELQTVEDFLVSDIPFKIRTEIPELRAASIIGTENYVRYRMRGMTGPTVGIWNVDYTFVEEELVFNNIYSTLSSNTMRLYTDANLITVVVELEE